MLHEIGHALGLADDSNPSSIMYATLTAANETLSAVDIAGIQTLYGVSASTTAAPTPATAQAGANGQGAANLSPSGGGAAAQLIEALASFDPEDAAMGQHLPEAATPSLFKSLSLAAAPLAHAA